MTLRQVVNQLETQGVKVTFRVRPDGGIVVTSINGQKYDSRTGNAVARSMAGVALSEGQRAQRRAFSRAGVASRSKRIRLPKLPDDLAAALRRTQGIFREENLRRRKRDEMPIGSITTPQIRQKLMEGKTHEEIMESLSAAERYAKDLAQIDFLNAIREEINNDLANVRRWKPDDETNKIQRVAFIKILEECSRLFDAMLTQKPPAPNARNADAREAQAARYAFESAFNTKDYITALESLLELRKLTRKMQ